MSVVLVEPESANQVADPRAVTVALHGPCKVVRIGRRGAGAAPETRGSLASNEALQALREKLTGGNA